MKGRDEEILQWSWNINVIDTCTDIPECIMAEEMRHAMQDDHVSELTSLMIHG